MRWAGLVPRPPRKQDRETFEEKVRPSMWGQFVARRWWEERKRLMMGKRSGRARPASANAVVNPLLTVAMSTNPIYSDGASIRKMASQHLGTGMDEFDVEED